MFILEKNQVDSKGFRAGHAKQKPTKNRFLGTLCTQIYPKKNLYQSTLCTLQPTRGWWICTNIFEQKTSEMFEIRTIGSEAWKSPSMWVVFFWRGGGIHVAYHPKVGYIPWKSKTKQRMVFRMIHVKDSLLPMGKVWSLDFLGIHMYLYILFEVDAGKYTNYLDPSWVLLGQKTYPPNGSNPFNPCQV